MVNPCELAAFCGEMKIMTLCLQYCSFDVQKVIYAAVKNDHLDCVIAVLMEHNYVFTSDDCVFAAMHNSYYSMIFMLESIYLHDLTFEILETAFVCGHFKCFIAALRHGCPLPLNYKTFYDIDELSEAKMKGFYFCFKFAVNYGVSDILLSEMMDWMTVVGDHELSKKLYVFCKKKGRLYLINPTILDDAFDVL